MITEIRFKELFDLKKKLSIIAPMYNEENLVEQYCEIVLEDTKILEKNYEIEILLINDGSKDKTYDRMKKMYDKFSPHISIINLSRNFGLEGAINAGLSVFNGDIAVVMDADLQDPPSVIKNLVDKYEEGYDVVVAKRKKRESDTFFKKFSAGMYYKLTDKLSGKLKLERNAANFRLLSKNAVKELLKLQEVNRIFRVLVPFIGMKTAVIEYNRDKRFSGTTKYNIVSMLKYALDGITSVSIEPLRKIFSLFLLSVLFTVIFLILTIVLPSSWRKIYFICFIMSLFMNIVLICLSLIGEYIAQIMIEVKKRPTSIIYEHKSLEKKENNNELY